MVGRRTWLCVGVSVVLLALIACGHPEPEQHFDLIVRGGTVYDGTGSPGIRADVGVVGDRIAAVGDLTDAGAGTVVDAAGLAVAPGFINVFSWSVESLMDHPGAVADLKQGVTTQIFGEGVSKGPLSDEMKAMYEDAGQEVSWTTFGEHMEMLERHGVAPNIAGFVGATTVRVHELGMGYVQPDAAQLERMKELVAQAMEEGSLGVSTGLIYPPGNAATTEELIELSRVAAEYGGIYTSHIRDEGLKIFEAVDEVIRIAREAGIPAEIYHLKIAHQEMWSRADELAAKIESARVEGLEITADVYTYTAGGTGLDVLFPPWVKEEGTLAEKFQDPEIRARVKREILTPGGDWENFYLSTGPERVLLASFSRPEMEEHVGRTLAEVAAERGAHPADTAMDLMVEDGGRPLAMFFGQSEDVLRNFLARPWVSFCSDAPALDTEAPEQRGGMHPRAYGNFARVVGKYARDEQVISLPEAIRKLTSQPAATYRLADRGRLVEDAIADLVVFDPETIADHATFENPWRFSTGVHHVWVNGVQVLSGGEFTGATPGVFVRGLGAVPTPTGS